MARTWVVNTYKNIKVQTFMLQSSLSGEMFPNTWKLKKTNNAPDSFKMKTPGHSNLCVCKVSFTRVQDCVIIRLLSFNSCAKIYLALILPNMVLGHFLNAWEARRVKITWEIRIRGSMFSVRVINHTYAVLVVWLQENVSKNII